ncbi:hypothetical protein GCK72_021678 [Caenorhabditis remanei]|uniref:DUF7154 domain-containing protein n=1 Tax=Caenorhabditis remanei TaxID=31234 RepID=A0A6A5GLF4_CAERE|nr:hypothetical protein GCK72_021678 [Caenorhabditis remanei]KAF1755109.1 hypothetical protein GCK72_021678 [Caenorhabditis remanei]
MISRIKNIYAEFQSRRGIINNDSASVSSAPGTNEEPTTVEIIDTNPPSEFGLVDKQRHFGILRYTVTNRFRKLLLIALVNLVVVFAALIIFVFFLILHLNKKHEDIHISSTSHNHLETTTTSTPTTSAQTTKTDTTSHSYSCVTTTELFDNTAAKSVDDTGCSPNQKSTFFFAYSYDLTIDQVLNTWQSISNNSNFFFEKYALGIFDMMNSNNNITFSTFDSRDSFCGIYDTLLSGLPNSTESLKDPSEGGGVLSIIDIFFFEDITHCGATLFIITKRLPTDDNITDLVSMLQKYHTYVTFVVSNNSFGGSSPESMYRLASETNGLCIFTDDDRIQETPTWLPSIWPSYLVYSFNANVTNSGSVTLPIFNSPLVGYYYICMTLQDHGSLDTFRMVKLTWYNAKSSKSGYFEETVESHADYGNTTYVKNGPYTLDAVPYNMTLEFEYSDDKIKILQIRIYSVSAADFWVPYNN